MNISTGTKGAAYELLVAADLMRSGFQVFRNMSPNGHVDLLVIPEWIPENAPENKVVLRVQVKSGLWVTPATLGKYVVENNDILAIFNGKIQYTGLSASGKRHVGACGRYHP